MTTETSNRDIEYLNDRFFNTSLREKVEVVINYFDFVSTESCHIVTPDGHTYNLENISIDGIKVIKGSEVACGVEIKVISKHLVGNWMLFSRDTRHSTLIERRLNFVIYVEGNI